MVSELRISFWIAVRNRLHLDRTECQSICCLICYLLFFLCCQNSILLVYLHLSSYLVAIAEKISDVLIDQALKIITEFLNNFVL